jgi:hypothetical protein
MSNDTFHIECGMCQGTGEVDTGGQTPYGTFISDTCPHCNGSAREVCQLTAMNWKQRTDELVQTILGKWDEWEAEAGQNAQIQQDPEAGKFIMELNLTVAIQNFLFRQPE